MLAPPIPKSWLIHTITYEKYLGVDRYNDISYEAPVTIEFVRVDNSIDFSKNSNENKRNFTGVIFIDCVHSTKGIMYVEESKITFIDIDGNENKMTVKAVIPLYHPNSSKIHHYELEVI